MAEPLCREAQGGVQQQLVHHLLALGTVSPPGHAVQQQLVQRLVAARAPAARPRGHSPCAARPSGHSPARAQQATARPRGHSPPGHARWRPRYYYGRSSAGRAPGRGTCHPPRGGCRAPPAPPRPRPPRAFRAGARSTRGVRYSVVRGESSDPPAGRFAFARTSAIRVSDQWMHCTRRRSSGAFHAVKARR